MATRTRQEREKVARAWRKSGLSAREFCKGRELSVTSLYRWSQQVGSVRASSEASELRLIEAVPEMASSTGALGGWACEVSGPRGTVRVRDTLDGVALQRVIEAVLGGGER
jgi:hypothetical protein